MYPTKNIIVAAALSVIFCVAHFAAAQAAEGAQTLKPLQGVSFHVGSKHAVGYYLNDSSTCKLVLTLADDANYAPTRFEAAIQAGTSTRYDMAQGKSLEFACQADGQTMRIDALETVATNG